MSAPRIARYHPHYLSSHEIEKILIAIDSKTAKGKRDLAVIELLYGCGLRISELINLRSIDIEFEAGFIRVTGKGGKQRLVPLGGYASKALKEYQETCQDSGIKEVSSEDFVFSNRKGRPLSRVTLWKAVRKAVIMAGITKKVSPHTFRHSFATHLIEGGANLRVVQEMLGHADISTTEIYTTVDRDYLIAEHRRYHPRELAGTDND